MIFDGGDIIILSIAIIILFVFRQLDKNKRSLEKVRRYADKVKKELDVIVQERETALRNLAGELEAKENTNREILSRVQDVREQILSRSKDIEITMERIEGNERALTELNDLALKVDGNLGRLKEESSYVDGVGSRLSDLKTRLGDFQKGLDEKLIEFSAKDELRFESVHKELFENFDTDLSRMRDNVNDIARRIDHFQDTLGQFDSNREEAARKDLESFKEKMLSLEKEFHLRLQKVAEEGTRLEDEAFSALNEKIASRGDRLEENWLGGLTELKTRVSTTVSEIEEQMNTLREEREVWEAENNEKLEAVDRGIKDTEELLQESLKNVESSRVHFVDHIADGQKELDDNLVKLREHMVHTAEEKEIDLLQSVESRQAEFRRGIEERFGTLEAFITDMDSLAESLKASQKQMLKDVDASFKDFETRMSEQRSLEWSRVEEEAAEIRQIMENLEQGLNELKSRAYDNVSEKLRVFEDDFQADLQKRGEKTQGILENWQKNSDLQLEELTAKSVREREEVEQRYASELDQKLTELQTRIYGQLESFQDQVTGFQDSLWNRVRGTEEELNNFRESLSAEIAKHREIASTEFQREFDDFSRQVTERLAKTDKAASQQLAGFAEKIETGIRELMTAVEENQNEITRHKESLSGLLEKEQRKVAENLDSIESDMTVSMTELRSEFIDRTEELMLNSGKERSGLRKELSNMEESMTRLSTELGERSRDTLESLREEGEGFLLDFRGQVRDAREEGDRKIKELRQAITDAKERAEATRQELVSQTGEEYSKLAMNLEDISRRQKELITETRILERTEQLKNDLENDIAELNNKKRDVLAGKEEILSIQEEYKRTITLYEEVSNRLNLFAAEQQKVENLEGKISRIVSLSESVNHKFKRVTETHDALQELQIRHKQLEDFHEDLTERYERLEKRSEILDSAASGVDRNFQRMNVIEDLIKDVAERILPLKSELETAENRQEQLLSSRKTVDTIVSRLDGLEGIISELDGRMQELSKAREWLARTETRLEEIGKETQQKIKLLGTLTKREGSGGSRMTGSPDMSTREIVVRLAREGWNSEEIARTTRLSRGEVELILELTPKE